jgi:nucleoside-diphosphate-sugar epimerase
MLADERLEPRTDYAVGKAAATMLCQAEAIKGRPITTVRIFSAFGPWEDATRLVMYLMGCCLRRKSPRVTVGWQPRDFVFVDDVIDLLLSAATKRNVCGRILHAGTGYQRTVREMVETVVRVCADDQIEPIFGAEATRDDEPTHWVASIEETSRLTGWSPRHNLRAGIERTWEWFRAVGAARAA